MEKLTIQEEEVIGKLFKHKNWLDRRYFCLNNHTLITFVEKRCHWRLFYIK